MARLSHRTLPLVTLFLALAPALALGLGACNSGPSGPLNRASMESAGGLSESRMPSGLVGNSPAPTGAKPRDKALEAGWYKRAHEGDKAPTYGDHPAF